MKALSTAQTHTHWLQAYTCWCGYRSITHSIRSMVGSELLSHRFQSRIEWFMTKKKCTKAQCLCPHSGAELVQMTNVAGEGLYQYLPLMLPASRQTLSGVSMFAFMNINTLYQWTQQSYYMQMWPAGLLKLLYQTHCNAVLWIFSKWLMWRTLSRFGGMTVSPTPPSPLLSSESASDSVSLLVNSLSKSDIIYSKNLCQLAGWQRKEQKEKLNNNVTI